MKVGCMCACVSVGMRHWGQVDRYTSCEMLLALTPTLILSGLPLLHPYPKPCAGSTAGPPPLTQYCCLSSIWDGPSTLLLHQVAGLMRGFILDRPYWIVLLPRNNQINLQFKKEAS